MHTDELTAPTDGATQNLSTSDPLPMDLLHLIGRPATRVEIEARVARFCGDITTPTAPQLRALWEHAQALSHGWASVVAPTEMLGRCASGTLPLEGALVGSHRAWRQAVHDLMVERAVDDSPQGRDVPEFNAVWTGTHRTCWGATLAGGILEVVTRPWVGPSEAPAPYAVVAVRLGRIIAAIVSANLPEERDVRFDEDEAAIHGQKRLTRYIFLTEDVCRIGARTPRPHTRVAWGRHLGSDEARVVAALRGAE